MSIKWELNDTEYAFFFVQCANNTIEGKSYCQKKSKINLFFFQYYGEKGIIIKK